jgi:hypothetical protein
MYYIIINLTFFRLYKSISKEQADFMSRSLASKSSNHGNGCFGRTMGGLVVLVAMKMQAHAIVSGVYRRNISVLRPSFI